MERKEMAIEIKETGKEMQQRFQEFFEEEVRREEFLQNSSSSTEKEVKKILSWIAVEKQQRKFIIATLERVGDCTIMNVSGGRKEFRSHKNMDDVKKALEYIAENVCGEHSTLKNLEVSRMNTVKVAFTVKIKF